MVLIAKSQTEREVAAELGLSYHTIHQHVRTIYKKLGVSNRVEMVSKFLGEQKALNRTVELLMPIAMSYCPGCGCHLAAVTTPARAS